MMIKKNKPILTVAGPGAGKTHDMINQIIECIPQIEPHRYLAVITYTRAATKEIKERLQKEVYIPPNFFVGTIHSFLITFILNPFCSLYNDIPDDRIFVDLVVSGESKDPKVKAIQRARKVGKLLEKGIIPYDEVINQSRVLMENKTIRSIVGDRLQVLFIDEYQDATVAQHAIFDEIRKENKTKIYCVGDPEQYIMGFTYQGKQKPKYCNIPFFKMMANADIKEIRENYRSTPSIVNFINHFNTNVKQISVNTSGDKEVSFIKETNLKKIITQFNQICNQHIFNSSNGNVLKFYLSYENKTYAKVAEEFGLTEGGYTGCESNTLFSEVMDFISKMLQKSSSSIMKEKNIDIIEYRNRCFQILKNSLDTDCSNSQDIIELICDVFGVSILDLVNDHKKYAEDFVNRIKNSTRDIKNQGQYMTIHKSKGLQADAVLIVAKSNKELNMWLETDKTKRQEDKEDKCRLGFVAFSRAKEVLCIACLESLSSETEQKLNKLNVKLTFG